MGMRIGGDCHRCGSWLAASYAFVKFFAGETLMNDSDFDLELEELSSAEDFLDYFGVAYDPAVVQVNRLHILQRFHDYLEEIDEPLDAANRRELYRGLLQSAYRDFVVSDARSEKVFRVFQMRQPQPVLMVPLAQLTGGAGAA